MDNDTLVGIAVGIIAAILIKKFFFSEKAKGRISDDAVTVELIKEILKTYRIRPLPNRKDGYTEKDVQKDLYNVLKTKIENVTREYALEGTSKSAIDFDLGNGRVGVEIKLARKVYGANERHRAMGQMVEYIKKKYKNGNYVIAVVGTKEDEDNSHYREFQKDVTHYGGHIIFIPEDTRTEEVKAMP